MAELELASLLSRLSRVDHNGHSCKKSIKQISTDFNRAFKTFSKPGKVLVSHGLRYVDGVGASRKEERHGETWRDMSRDMEMLDSGLSRLPWLSHFEVTFASKRSQSAFSQCLQKAWLEMLKCGKALS